MDASPTSARAEYPLAQAPADLQRLIARVSRRNPGTRELLAQAGLAPGMRVIDAGSGAGDVALIAAELVGPSGTVLGLDLNPESLEVARARAEAAALGNIEFRVGDAQDIAALALADGFDAVIGRLVLMYTHDPAAVLRGLVGLARPGAVVAFEEIDFAVLGWAMHPPGPVFAQANGWLREAFVRLGAHPAMGFELHATFLAAGLPAPALRLNALVGAGPDCDLYEIHAGVIASLLPKLVELGIATAEEVGIETLASRLREEAVVLGATSSSPPLIGGWTRKP
jgi:ubiquinone/menaquinone biosynthesis C-methylase UbiE